MRFRTAVLILAISVLGAAHLKATVLPDACGDDKVKFEVTTQKAQGPLPAVDEGMAQVVFIETSPHSVFIKSTIRFGMDGKWIGANRVNSYFVLSVTPGEHHLCVNWQSSIKVAKKAVGMAAFTAEAGKVYYYEARIIEGTAPPTAVGGGAPGQPPPTIIGGGTPAQFIFGALSEDEGKYRIKISEVSTSKPKI